MLKERAVSAMRIPGISQDGASWLAKALHPSDNVPKLVGIPSADSVPTACVNYTNTYVIAAPAGQIATATWDTMISTVMHPLTFGKWRSIGSNGAAIYQSGTLLNTQLGGSGLEVAIHLAIASTWRNAVTRYRPMYMGSTFTLTAPTLSDQGTVTSAQIPLDYADLNFIGASTIGCHRTRVVPDFDIPAGVVNTPEFSFASLQSQPGAFTSAAREGAYVVMKLDQEALTYKTTFDTVNNATIVDANIVTTDPSVAITSVTSAPIHPYLPDATCTRNNGGAVLFNQSSFPLSSNMMGLTIFKGLSSAATITVTTRVGFECVVPADSILQPSVEKACSYDPVALNAYWSISKEMMSTYPASYNFLGTLWTVVKSIGSAVLPNLVPALGKLFGGPSSGVTEQPPPKPAPTAPYPKQFPPMSVTTMQRPAPSVVSGRPTPRKGPRSPAKFKGGSRLANIRNRAYSQADQRFAKVQRKNQLRAPSTGKGNRVGNPALGKELAAAIRQHPHVKDKLVKYVKQYGKMPPRR
jgi:hypothetical protein